MASGEKILVVGMGKSGFSMARYYHNLGLVVEAVDDRRNIPCLSRFLEKLPDVPFQVAPFHQWAPERFGRYDCIALSPGVNRQSLRINDAVRIVGDAQLFANHLEQLSEPPLVLAVTGTNGKSTVVSLIRHVLSEQGVRAEAVGNIGYPLLDAVYEWERNGYPQVAVVELSSFQLECVVDFPSDCATILNVDYDHMDRYQSIEQYRQVKARIYDNARSIVLNSDGAAYGDVADAAVISISAAGRCADWHIADGVVYHDKIQQFAMDQLPPALQIQPANLLTACAMVTAVAEAIDDTLEDRSTVGLVDALSGFRGLEHRLQFVGTHRERVFINDSKATNVAATLFALSKNRHQPVVLIAGGEDKNQDFTPLAEEIKARPLRGVVLIGEDTGVLERALTDIATTPAHTMDRAVHQALALSQPGDIILLSPACSSLDQYENYEARGDCFINHVNRLAEG